MALLIVGTVAAAAGITAYAAKKATRYALKK